MRPQVDRELCIGCGLCADTAPDVFELSDEAVSTVIADATPENTDAVQESIDACPTAAISWA